jgi:uncharacterized repeat protein (TIGR01451 family)
MKNLFKAIGRKTYYSLKRFARAMKSLNILTFGAVFLAGILMPTPVMAEGDFVRATISPTSSTIELGQSKTFGVVTKLNGMPVAADSINWFVDGAASGSAASMVYTPTAVGDYQVRVNVTKNGIVATSQASLKVKDATGDTNDDDVVVVTDDENIFIRAVVTPTSSTITEGQSKTFSVVTKKNGATTSADSINWFVDDSPQASYANLNYMTLSPDAGTYSIRVNVVKDSKLATSYATLNVLAGNSDPDPDPVDPDPSGPDFLRAVITPTSSTIDEGESKMFNLISKLNGSTITPDTIKWFVDNGEQVSARNQSYLILSPDAGTYSIRAIATKANANVSQSYATLVVREGTTPPVPSDDFVRAVITPTSSTVNVGTSKTYNLITKLNGFNHVADTIRWYVDGVHQPQANNQTYITLNRPVGTYSINAKAWINGVMGQDTATLTVKDVIIVTDDHITVEITPNNPTVNKYEETTYSAIVRDENGQNVTSSTSLDWSIVGGNAEIVTESHDYFRVRAFGNIGTFHNIRVDATRVGGNNPDTDYANDTAYLTVRDNYIPPVPVCDYYLTSTVYGVIEDGSSPTSGDIIKYTVKVNNYRPCTLTNVNVRVGIPAHTSFVDTNSAYGTPYLSGNNIYWNAGTLVPNQEKTMYFRVRINNNVPAEGWYITAYGDANANEISKFNIQSNTIFVPGSTTPPPVPPLPPTGIDWMTLLLIVMASLGMATLTYAWMYSRRVRYEEARF